MSISNCNNCRLHLSATIVCRISRELIIQQLLSRFWHRIKIYAVINININVKLKVNKIIRIAKLRTNYKL